MLNLNTIEALVPSKGCGCEVYIEEAGSYKQNSVDLSLKPMPITDAKSKITRIDEEWTEFVMEWGFFVTE